MSENHQEHEPQAQPQPQPQTQAVQQQQQQMIQRHQSEVPQVQQPLHELHPQRIQTHEEQNHDNHDHDNHPHHSHDNHEHNHEHNDHHDHINQDDPQSPSYSSNSKSVQDIKQQNQPDLKQQQGSPKPKQQPTDQNQVQRTRYKYCCKICKHTGQGKRACVCVVPLSERRTIIGQQGCQTCKCKGCSIEDFISRGQDPVYRIVKINSSLEQYDPKKMCCKKCMRAFYNNGKPCFCQYPPKDRKGRLKMNGCSLCGCHGCNTDDYNKEKAIKDKEKERQREKEREKQKEKEKEKRRVSKSRSRQKKRKTRRSRSRSVSSSPSRRSFSPEIVDMKAMNFNNFDRSWTMIVNDFRIFPGLMGFGVPQRTQSYIMNQPKR